MVCHAAKCSMLIGDVVSEVSCVCGAVEFMDTFLIFSVETFESPWLSHETGAPEVLGTRNR